MPILSHNLALGLSLAALIASIVAVAVGYGRPPETICGYFQAADGTKETLRMELPAEGYASITPQAGDTIYLRVCP